MKIEEVESVNINIQDAQKVLELFSKLDNKKKEIALATLTGMVLVTECDKKGA